MSYGKMNDSKTVVILNPSASGGSTGKKTEKILKKVHAALGSGVRSLLTRERGDATSFAREALEDGAETVVAIGGDGTANEVVNGFFVRKGTTIPTPINRDAVMAFIPMGTRNVISKSYGLPKTLDSNLALVRGNKSTLVDVLTVRAGRQGARVFLNAAEIGLGAHIIDRSRKIREVVNSRTISTLATVISTVPTYRSNQCEISVDDGEWWMFPHVTMCTVSNGAYLGGGFKMAPEADTADGLLDTTVVKDAGSLKLLDQLRHMKAGRFAKDENVVYFQSGKISIRSEERDVHVTVDGEPAGSLPAKFQVIPSSLRFV